MVEGAQSDGDGEKGPLLPLAPLATLHCWSGPKLRLSD